MIQDVNKSWKTMMRCAVGVTEVQGGGGTASESALSQFLFAMVMDSLADEVGQKSPWTLMFADDSEICSETEYMYVNERNSSGTVRWRKVSGVMRASA